MKLFGKTSLLAIAATAAVAFTISTANAQETETIDVTATVQNAFDLTITTPMSFGTLAAVRRGAGGGAVATFELAPDGTPTVTNGAGVDDDIIVRISGHQEAVVDITNAIPTTEMFILFPAATTLECALCTPANPVFDLGSYTSSEALNEFTSDVAGAYTFTVGATLSTVAGVDEYEDGLYEGAFDITVTY